MFGIRRAILLRSRWKFVVYSLVRAICALLCVLFLGFLDFDWDTKLLFSDWMDS